MKKIPLFYLLVSLLFCSCSPKDPAYDYILANANIVDGLGNPSFEGSLAIKEDRIAKISSEPLDSNLAIHYLDLSGLTLAPGFIDLHTNVTVDLHEHPFAENFLRQGTTTILASLHSGEQAYPLEDYASKLKTAINIGFFAGHSWTREKVIGLENRSATAEELEEMEQLVRETMQQGALGLSTGLEYVPANYAPTEEITALAKVAASEGGVYFTHMRDEGRGVLTSIREAIEVGKSAEIPVQINHLKAAGKTQWGWSEKMLRLIDSANTAGIKVGQDIYPYTAFSTYAYILIPRWALAGGVDSLRARLETPQLKRQIKAEMRELFMRDGCGEDLSLIRFRNFEYDPSFSGRTLADYALSQNLAPNLENGIDLLLEIELNGGFIGIFEAMSPEDIQNFIKHPGTMFDSDGDLTELGKGHPHPRSLGAFPRLIGEYVREKKILSLEEAIQKLSSMPADIIKQKDRGRIKEGAIADLCIFDFQTIHDQATYIDPHHFPSGIHYIFVNGEAVIEAGQLSDRLPGKWIQGNQSNN